MLEQQSEFIYSAAFTDPKGDVKSHPTCPVAEDTIRSF